MSNDRRYIVKRENVKTGKVVTLSDPDRPMTHAEAVTFKSKMMPYRWARDFLEEVETRAKNPARKTRKKNPTTVHVDVNSHNTKGRNVRAKNPARRRAQKSPVLFPDKKSPSYYVVRFVVNGVQHYVKSVAGARVQTAPTEDGAKKFTDYDDAENFARQHAELFRAVGGKLLSIPSVVIL